MAFAIMSCVVTYLIRNLALMAPRRSQPLLSASSSDKAMKALPTNHAVHTLGDPEIFRRCLATEFYVHLRSYALFMAVKRLWLNVYLAIGSWSSIEGETTTLENVFKVTSKQIHKFEVYAQSW